MEATCGGRPAAPVLRTIALDSAYVSQLVAAFPFDDAAGMAETDRQRLLSIRSDVRCAARSKWIWEGEGRQQSHPHKCAVSVGGGLRVQLERPASRHASLVCTPLLPPPLCSIYSYFEDEDTELPCLVSAVMGMHIAEPMAAGMGATYDAWLVPSANAAAYVDQPQLQRNERFILALNYLSEVNTVFEVGGACGTEGCVGRAGAY